MQHYTRNTVEASAWCKRCGRDTMHRIDGVKLGPCLHCMAVLEEQHETAKPAPAAQARLFAE